MHMADVNMGRTGRGRNRRKRKDTPTQSRQCNDDAYVTFLRWAKNKGLDTKQLKLRPSNFNGTNVKVFCVVVIEVLILVQLHCVYL